MPRAKLQLDEDGFGPAMRLLTEKQRAFVIAKVDNPTIADWKAAEVAKYGGGAGGGAAGHGHVMRQIGYRLAHNEKIIEGIHEETGKRMRLGGMLGVANLIRMASDPEHRDHFRASVALAEREFGAIAQKVEVSGKIEHSDLTGAAIKERLLVLAAKYRDELAKHGLDVRGLLEGPAGVSREGPAVVEGEFAVVTDG